jgi:flavin-dependent dehydrogenase
LAERAEAVIVGARCAGSAAAIALARAGRRVIALDSSAFPSDTLSTHLLWASGVAEVSRLGALERVEALGAPRLPEALAGWNGYEIRGGYSAVDGIDYGMCVRRPGLDAALVETAREAGAEIRERTKVTEVLGGSGGRVAGVRWKDREGNEGEIAAPLVIGADGRRSRVGRSVGVVDDPVLAWDSGRGCYFAYWQDAHDDWRHVAAQWRRDEELVTAFPCDGGQILVLLMPPVEAAERFRADLEAAYEDTVARVPELAERLSGCERVTKVRHTPQTTSYFRRSTGSGWALVGDAGHFKDPVTAQGIRDAIRYGRLLGEQVAPHLDDADELDAALTRWERQRNQECAEIYHWTNRLGRAENMNPIEAELYRLAQGDPELGGKFLDVFSRQAKPRELLPLRRMLQLTARALRSDGASVKGVLRTLASELRLELRGVLERLRLRAYGLVRL